MGGIFFSLKVRKEGLLEDDSIGNAKKKEVSKWVSQKWVCSKNGQEHNDLKRYWGKWVK